MFLEDVTRTRLFDSRRTEEKGSDVNLASHLLNETFNDRFDVGRERILAAYLHERGFCRPRLSPQLSHIHKHIDHILPRQLAPDAQRLVQYHDGRTPLTLGLGAVEVGVVQ